MTTRVLPVEEWPRLAGTELETIWPIVDPRLAHMLVVEDGPEVVGCWALLTLAHVEGLWIAPAHRHRGRVFARLIAGMRALARAEGFRAVGTAADTDTVRALLVKAGAHRVPGESYVLQVWPGLTGRQEGTSRCQ